MQSKNNILFHLQSKELQWINDTSLELAFYRLEVAVCLKMPCNSALDLLEYSNKGFHISVFLLVSHYMKFSG